MNSNDRIDSWKEIAGYIRRDERTVRRWEVDRALPVHRIPGNKRGSVYAFCHELESWLANQCETYRRELPPPIAQPVGLLVSPVPGTKAAERNSAKPTGSAGGNETYMPFVGLERCSRWRDPLTSQRESAGWPFSTILLNVTCIGIIFYLGYRLGQK